MLLWICASAVIQQMNKTEKPGNVISKNGLYTIYIKLYIFFCSGNPLFTPAQFLLLCLSLYKSYPFEYKHIGAISYYVTLT